MNSSIFFSFFYLCLGLEICLVGALGIQKVGDLLFFPPSLFAVYVQGTHLKGWLEMRTEGIAPPRCVRIN